MLRRASELFAQVAFKLRPACRAGDDFGEVADHLAAVAHAQCQRVRVGEEGGKLVAQSRVEQNRFRPAFACAEYVAVAEAAARRQHFEVGKVDAACHQVGHMHVVGIETGAGEGGCQFRFGRLRPVRAGWRFWVSRRC